MFKRPETPLWSPSLSKDAKIQLVWGSSLTQIWISILSYCPHNDWKINYKGHQRYSLHNMHCLKKDFMVEPHRHEHIEAICLPLWAHAHSNAPSRRRIKTLKENALQYPQDPQSWDNQRYWKNIRGTKNKRQKKTWWHATSC